MADSDRRMIDANGQYQRSPNDQHFANGSQGAPPTGNCQPSAASVIRGLQDLAPSQELQRINTISPTSTSDAAQAHNRKDVSRPVSRDQPNSASSTSVTPSLPQPTTPQPPSNRQTPTFQSPPTQVPGQPSFYSPPANVPTQAQGARPKRDSEALVGVSGSPQQPTRKRARHEEPPIFARKASRSTSNSPLLPNKRQNGPRNLASVKLEAQDTKSALLQSSVPATIKEEANGHPPPPPPSNEVALPKAQPELAGFGPLGPWEPSIINIIPSEEVTRIISDFLFTQVVLRDDVGAGPAGGGPGQGAVLEIEAKIGQLIDKNTNDRLKLPVMSECVVSKDDPNLRITFKSSMTEVSKSILAQIIIGHSQFGSKIVSTPCSKRLPQRRTRPLATPQTAAHESSNANQTPHPNVLRPHQRMRHLLRTLSRWPSRSPALHPCPTQPPPPRQSPHHNGPKDGQRTGQNRQGSRRGPRHLQPPHGIRLACQRQPRNELRRRHARSRRDDGGGQED